MPLGLSKRLVRTASQHSGEPSEPQARGDQLGHRDGQGGDQRSGGPAALLGQAVEGAVAADELLRVMGVEPGLAFAVANLLAPIGLDRRTMVMPDERTRS